MIDSLFPSETLTDEESALIYEVFSNATVRKYLKILGAESAKDLLTLPVLNETPASVLNKHTLTTGKLEVLATLLSIEGIKP